MELVIDAETHDPNISLGKGAGWVYDDFEVLGFAVKKDNEPTTFISNVKELEELIKKADTLICHNAQYDIGCLHRLNILYGDKTIIDTMILMKLYDNTLLNYKLESLAVDILGIKKENDLLKEACKELGLKGTPHRHMKELFKHRRDVVEQYAKQDVEITKRIYKWVMGELYAEAIDLLPFYSDLIKALVKWRAKGVCVDINQAEKSRDALEALFDIEMEKFSYFCPEVNIESSRQLAESFREMGLEPNVTDKGNDSIDAAWRSTQHHPAVVSLSNAKKYQKLKRDFIDGVMVRSERGRIFPEINILGAAHTGRFSSSNPNIQQCYDDKTEVLTETRGFVLFRDLLRTDRVASWVDGDIVFTDYSDPIVYKADHINSIRSKAGRINLAVTDDHRCLRMNREGKLDVYHPKEHNGEWLHLHGGLWQAKPIKIFDSFLDLVLAIHSIGNINIQRGVDFFICHNGQAQRLLTACRELGIPIQKLSKFATGAIHVFIDINHLPPAIWRYIDNRTFHLTPKTMLFAKDELINHIRLWYHHFDKKDIIYTRQKQSADMIQIMLSLSNSSCTVYEERESGEPIYRIYVHDEYYSRTDSATLLRKPYTGNVFCISVPSTFLLVRREGTTSISGNCPARDDISNTLVRSLFIPEEGDSWYSLDFSSQEPRVQLAYAYKAGCPGADALRQAFIYNPKHDLHQQVADICRISRKQAKTINLAISYGMSRRATSKILSLTEKQTNEIFRRYHVLTPYLNSINKLVKESAIRKGYVKSMLGRRMLLDLEHPYKALNLLIQGSSSDMMATCLVKAYRNNLPVMFSVHDSIELSSSDIKHAKEMKNIMEWSFEKELPIPFSTDIKVGSNWGDVK